MKYKSIFFTTLIFIFSLYLDINREVSATKLEEFYNNTDLSIKESKNRTYNYTKNLVFKHSPFSLIENSDTYKKEYQLFKVKNNLKNKKSELIELENKLIEEDKFIKEQIRVAKAEEERRLKIELLEEQKKQQEKNSSNVQKEESDKEINYNGNLEYFTNCNNASSGDRQSVKELVYCVWGNESDEHKKIAWAISNAENRTHNCTSLSPTADMGLFQVNQVHWGKYANGNKEMGKQKLMDCKYNVEKAYEIYKGWGGFKPWTTYTGGKYLQFLE